MPWSKIGPYPGAHYKDHFACFTCRKMVRKPSALDPTVKDPHPSCLFQCPECGNTLSSMGRAFRPPRQGAIRQWRKVEEQYRVAVRWPSGRW